MSIHLRGVRHNNLKNFDLEVPLGRLVVIAGLSGSGKSSLAFDTLFAEGQRRYIETFSPYARQFLDRMDKPRVDSIEGIPPAIAIEQRNSVKSTRSTVGTMTEITEHAKILWSHIAQLYCRGCGAAVRKDSPQKVWEIMRAEAPDADALVTFDLPLTEKLSLDETLALVARQGYQRVLIDSQVKTLADGLGLLKAAQPRSLTLVQDRVALKSANRGRFIEACEQAYHFGKSVLTVRVQASGGPAVAHRFSNKLHCAKCDIDYAPPSPALFSFNHPVGACPKCRGFGRTIAIDYNAALPDRSKTLAQGAVKPWQTATGAECQQDMTKFAKVRKIPMDVPFEKLSKAHQDWVIDGDPGYGSDKEHQWPRAWYGVKGYFRWLESKAYKMHVRVLLSRYRIYEPCAECGGTRYRPDPLLYRISSKGNTQGEFPKGLTIANFYRLPVTRALEFVKSLSAGTRREKSDPIELVLNEVASRLTFLEQAGLGYLTLDRMTRSLSGGETERVNLTTCLGSRLVNTLFVLDEPTVGLHPRDTERLVKIIQSLRDNGNSVVVVEHESGVMRVADQIIELGPGHGESGGELVFQGSFEEILRATDSLTGQYLSGRKRIEHPTRRPVSFKSDNGTPATPTLVLSNASLHNLKNVTVEIPLGRFVCVSGVSGSGKTTLISQVLLPELRRRVAARASGYEFDSIASPEDDNSDSGDAEVDLADSQTSLGGGPRIQGWEALTDVVAVDQSSLGKTPRSNPAVYIGAFDDVRAFFADTEAAKQRGLNASSFSFNSAQGQCQRCRGAGFEKIEMQFLSDVFIQCPDCNGRRYRQHILEVLAKPPGSANGNRAWSIADLLEATVDEAVLFLKSFPDSRPAARAAERLQLLQEAGLGYLRAGQPINTLSGGESQRLKLVSHLAAVSAQASASPDGTNSQNILFIFDEPTTGLHFDDVRVLLKLFHRIVDSGHSVLVIEHNLDVINSADWVIDLGPDAGEQGGEIVAKGTPDQIMSAAASHTGEALRKARDFASNRPKQTPSLRGSARLVRAPREKRALPKC
jgi:excinuclease ABC subunit A